MKFGINAYKILVAEPLSYGVNAKEIRCLWLGHTRFKCGHCKLGYFNVRSPIDYDDKCPSCHWHVVMRWDEEES